MENIFRIKQVKLRQQRCIGELRKYKPSVLNFRFFRPTIPPLTNREMLMVHRNLRSVSCLSKYKLAHEELFDPDGQAPPTNTNNDQARRGKSHLNVEWNHNIPC